jgi:hypothetical protein
MIPGLYQLAKHKRQQAEWARVKIGNPHTDPRVAHECEVTAAQLEKESEVLLKHASENENFILACETLISGMLASEHGGPNRTLAIRHLESASMRLQRENGPKKSHD